MPFPGQFANVQPVVFHETIQILVLELEIALLPIYAQ